MSGDNFATLSTPTPSDQVMSADGTRLYVAGKDGNLRVNTATKHGDDAPVIAAMRCYE